MDWNNPEDSTVGAETAEVFTSTLLSSLKGTNFFFSRALPIFLLMFAPELDAANAIHQDQENTHTDTPTFKIHFS